MRTLFRATIALSVLCLPIVACSSDNTTYPDGGGGQQICPTTIIQATADPGAEGTTSACHVENYACAVGFSCGQFQQQANCVCQTQNGTQRFVCTLNAVPSRVLDSPVTDPNCALPPGPGVTCADLCQPSQQDGGTEPCPTDKTTAGGTACKNIGQICTYTTTCTGSPPPVDQCQCVGNKTGDAGLQWSCDLNQCP
jgi:hypothetical protein